MFHRYVLFVLTSVVFLTLWCSGCGDDETSTDPSVEDVSDAGGDVPDTGGSDGGTFDADAMPDRSRISCQSNADCDEGFYCVRATGFCQEACVNDDPETIEDEDSCRSVREPCDFCSESSGVCETDAACILCEDNDDCPPVEYCSLSEGEELGVCRDGCRLDPADNCDDCDLWPEQCGLSTTCHPIAHSCEFFCGVDADCASAARYCDPLRGECKRGCRLDLVETVVTDRCDTLDLEENYEDTCLSRHADSFGNQPDYACVVEEDNIRSCNQIICIENEDCPCGYICGNDAGCRLGCERDDQCGGDAICRDDIGLCGCDSDSDCTIEGTICPTAAETDFAPCQYSCCEACVDNDDCGGPEASRIPISSAAQEWCNPVSGRCFEDCVDEFPAAPDEPLGDLAVVGEGDSLTGVICGADIDWWQLDGETDVTIDLTIYFDPGDWSAQLFAATGFVSLLPAATGECVDPIDAPDDCRTRIVWDFDGPSDIKLKISGAGVTDPDTGASNLGYFADISRYEIGACLRDVWDNGDPPNDDTFPGAVEVDEDTHCGRALCNDDGGDIDYVTFTVPADNALVLSHSTSDAGAQDLKVCLYNAGQSQLGECMVNEPLVHRPSDEAVTYFASVSGLDPGNEDRDYCLAVDFVPTEACVEDEDPENDTAEDAENTRAAIGLPTDFEGRTLCAEDVDWFYVWGWIGGSIRVTLEPASGVRTIEVAIFDEIDAAEPIELYEGTDLIASLLADDLAASQRYYVSIRDMGGLAGTDGVDYDVTFQVLAAPCTDFHEEDDTRAQAGEPVIAYDATSYTSSGLVACDSDSDWFLIEVPFGASVSASLEVARRLNNMRMDLYDPDPPPADPDPVRAESSPTSATTRGFSDVPIGRGEVFIHVYSTELTVTGEPYTLHIDVDHNPAICDDRVPETPDLLCARETAALGDRCDEGEYCERVCQDDDDYYRLTVAGPTHVRIDFGFDEPDPEVRVELIEGIEDLEGECGIATAVLDVWEEGESTGFVEADFDGAIEAIILFQSNEDTLAVGDGYWFEVTGDVIE
jgi:hypothetical protein